MLSLIIEPISILVVPLSVFNNNPSKAYLMMIPFIQKLQLEHLVRKKNYSKNFLPDGLYWNVDEKTADVLKKLEPSNDLSGS